MGFQQPAQPDDAVQRRPDLMAHVCQELALGFARRVRAHFLFQHLGALGFQFGHPLAHRLFQLAVPVLQQPVPPQNDAPHAGGSKQQSGRPQPPGFPPLRLDPELRQCHFRRDRSIANPRPDLQPNQERRARGRQRSMAGRDFRRRRMGGREAGQRGAHRSGDREDSSVRPGGRAPLRDFAPRFRRPPGRAVDCDSLRRRRPSDESRSHRSGTGRLPIPPRYSRRRLAPRTRRLGSEAHRQPRSGGN